VRSLWPPVRISNNASCDEPDSWSWHSTAGCDALHLESPVLPGKLRAAWKAPCYLESAVLPGKRRAAWKAPCYLPDRETTQGLMNPAAALAGRLQLQAPRCETGDMSPVNVGAIGAYIREQREQAKISLRQLAQSAGISNPYLSQIERGLRRPSADILQQIAKGLRISAEALYVQAGFLEDRPPGSLVRDAVLTDEELTERQKQMLIEIYESFRKETAMVRAEAGELEDDQTGLAPDEAALGWPENLSPAALAGRPRRLAIASPYDEAGDYETDEEADEDGVISQFRFDGGRRDSTDEGSEQSGEEDGHGPGGADSNQGGTIHQFPPPAGTR
jgi:transcriptional regulator with XRE-family HTH domain